MCAVDDATPWKVSRDETRTARKLWRCEECGRDIHPGERYRFLAALDDYGWSSFRWCLHCDAASLWMSTVCGGHLIGDLLSELREHWDEGFRGDAFAQLIADMGEQWHGGMDPVPTGVSELARQMMQAQVAA